ncbi:MAG: hypothetical protein WAM30_21720 [Candidatus Dormiibacterota bacterium]
MPTRHHLSDPSKARTDAVRRRVNAGRPVGFEAIARLFADGGEAAAGVADAGTPERFQPNTRVHEQWPI